MLRNPRGFTIVELVLIVVVLGILVTIGTVAWGAVIPSSRDRTREADIRAWSSTFDLYKARFTVWPAIPANDSTPKSICLGSPASSDSSTFLPKCVQYTTSTEYTMPLGGTYSSAVSTDPEPMSLMTEVKKVGKMPVNSGPATKNILAGPFAYIWQVTAPSGTDVALYAHLIGFFETACPVGFSRITTYPVAVLPTAGITPIPPATYTTLFTSLPAIPSSIYACYLPKTLTYSTVN
ncbi:MAG: exported protein of unknown function [Candidatus Saccharibacteria bacterium]|nr:exported protein of unknown function [Candidatus Saccharibacteria bacterium]